LGNLDHVGQVLTHSRTGKAPLKRPEELAHLRGACSRALLQAVVAGSLLTSCGPPASGISGTTVVDVGCPALPVAETCAVKPLPARISVIDSKGARISVTTSNGRGVFRFELPPGEYDLQASNVTGAPLPSVPPVHVTVRAGHVTNLVITFDSGVR
jgi:hypothetical protein